MKDETCLWTLKMEDDIEVWHGDCGIAFILYDGTPEDNDMTYCPRCGRVMEEAT